MVYKNSNKTWKSSLILMELSFHYGFDITFNDRQSGNYVIRFYKNDHDIWPMSLGDQVISLN
jgi:hypothetical protein